MLVDIHGFTQYVNGEHTPINRRNRIPISSNRCTPSSSIKRKVHHPSSMFVKKKNQIYIYICLLIFVLFICFISMLRSWCRKGKNQPCLFA